MMLGNGWRSFEDMLPHILPHAVQCTEGLALDSLRDALMRACERARLWVVDDEFEQGCETDNLLVAPKQAQLFQIDRVSAGGRCLEPVTMQQLFGDQARCYTNGQPRYFAQVDAQSIAIYPVEPGAKVRVRAFMIPAGDAEKAPKAVMDRHREMLVNGALARILALPAQPFSNIELANYRGILFEQRLDEINREFATGAQRAPLRVRARFM